MINQITNVFALFVKTGRMAITFIRSVLESFEILIEQVENFLEQAGK